MVRKYKNLMKRKCAVGFSIAAILLAALPSSVMAAGKSYDITFRGGQHGMVVDATNGNNYVINTQAGETPVAPVVDADDGYYFKGWNKEVTAVTKKTDYVAKYGVIINAVEYTVKYVDVQSGLDLVTPVIKTTESGVSTTEAAPTIEGYTVDSRTKELVVTSEDIKKGNNVVVSFSYTADPVIVEETVTIQEPDTVIPNVVTTTGTTTPGQTAGTDNTGAAATTGIAAGNADTTTDNTANTPETETVPDEEVPLADGESITGDEPETTTVPDEDVPLSSMEVKSEKNWLLPTSIGIGALVLIGAGIWFYISRKRRMF